MRRTSLLLLAAVAPVAFANSNAGKKLYICTTPQPDDLDATEFAALAWVLIKGVGSVGETGASTNLLTYDTWDTDVTQKAKGITDGGSPEIELTRILGDAGQTALEAAANTNLNYAFRIEGNDKPGVDVGDKPTYWYNRGLVVGPRTPNGRNEDFDLEIYSLGLNQKQIKVNAVQA
jgi:hypothetical protein